MRSQGGWHETAGLYRFSYHALLASEDTTLPGAKLRRGTVVARDAAVLQANGILCQLAEAWSPCKVPCLWPLCQAFESISPPPGLEHCQALLSLDVTGNQLASLEGLRGCILLERLNAAHNALRELDWHHLPLLALGSLDLSSNRCSSSML